MIALLILMAIYFLPLIIAVARDKRNTGAIGIINLFLGWTFLFWVVGLAWACMEYTTHNLFKKTNTTII